MPHKRQLCVLRRLQRIPKRFPPKREKVVSAVQHPPWPFRVQVNLNELSWASLSALPHLLPLSLTPDSAFIRYYCLMAYLVFFFFFFESVCVYQDATGNAHKFRTFSFISILLNLKLYSFIFSSLLSILIKSLNSFIPRTYPFQIDLAPTTNEVNIYQ